MNKVDSFEEYEFRFKFNLRDHFGWGIKEAFQFTHPNLIDMYERKINPVYAFFELFDTTQEFKEDWHPDLMYHEL